MELTDIMFAFCGACLGVIITFKCVFAPRLMLININRSHSLTEG